MESGMREGGKEGNRETGKQGGRAREMCLMQDMIEGRDVPSIA